MPYLITDEQYPKLKSTIEDLLAPFDSIAFSDFVSARPVSAVTIKKADRLVTTRGYEIEFNLLEQQESGYVIEAIYDITDRNNISAVDAYGQSINLLKNPSFSRNCSICQATNNRSKGVIFSHLRHGDYCVHLSCIKRRLPELLPFITYLQNLPGLFKQLEQIQTSVFTEKYSTGAPLRLFLAIVEDEINKHGFVSKQDAIQLHHSYEHATYKKAETRYHKGDYPADLSFSFVEKAIRYAKQLKSSDLNNRLKTICEKNVVASNEFALAALIISNYIANNQGLRSHKSPLATDHPLSLHNDGQGICESLRLKGRPGDRVKTTIYISSCKYQPVTQGYDIRGKDDLGRVIQFNSKEAVKEKSYLSLVGVISKFYQNRYGYTVTVLKAIKRLPF